VAAIDVENLKVVAWFKTAGEVKSLALSINGGRLAVLAQNGDMEYVLKNKKFGCDIHYITLKS